MIDIHTHILPHLDDGAKNTQTSQEMLDKLVAQGVKSVVLTPHYYGKKCSPDEFVKRRNAAFEKIREKIYNNCNKSFTQERDIKICLNAHTTVLLADTQVAVHLKRRI